MVATDACSCATCDSSAMVTLSRKRRCTRVLTVRRNHVAAVDNPSPIAAPSTMPDLCSRTPLPSNISHKARSASGNAASCDSTNATAIKRGSWRYPSWHSRHMDDSAGGSGSIARSRSGEDVIRHALLLARGAEALRLQIEHRPIPPRKRHQLVVRAELDDPADRKSTRLNPSHGYISYAVFCLKKKTIQRDPPRPTSNNQFALISAP